MKREKSRIQYLVWNNSIGIYNRKVYRSSDTNIATTFSEDGSAWGGFCQNFLVYDIHNMKGWYDYFCLPDDLIIAYDDMHSFRSWAAALNWTTSHGSTTDGRCAFVRHNYTYGDGFSRYTNEELIRDAQWKAPPLAISVTHEMKNDENYVPMVISVRNTYSDPLHVLYILQDGSYLTEGTASQEHVRQYWDDGEYDSPGYGQSTVITG